MEKASESSWEVSEDEELKALEKAIELEELKEANRRAYAVDEALKEERKKMALGLLNKGVSIQIIQEVMGFSEEEIKNLKKS